MEPTYSNGEIIITKRIKGNYKPNRFDAVVISNSLDGDVITKRVLGLPGEKLIFINGKIYINGKLLHDPYRSKEWFHEKKTYHIPKDCLWVIGDNRPESLYGIFLIKEVEGLVW